MNPLTEVRINTPYGEKVLSVHCLDICDLDESLDVMTISAYQRSYIPLRHTLLGALKGKGISVSHLAHRPTIDLRELCGVWLSEELDNARLPIKRLGCIEMKPPAKDCSISELRDFEGRIIGSIHAYFSMLDIAVASGLPAKKVGIPILGGGSQHIDMDLVVIPIINECMAYLRRNEETQEIAVITHNASQAHRFAKQLEKSYAVTGEVPRRNMASGQGALGAGQTAEKPKKRIFLSYSSNDRNVADNLCSKLEAAGMSVWYAPRNVNLQDYATSIVQAIDSCTDFIVILSKSSLASQHVLNEINLAFQRLGRGVRFAPLKIDEEELGPAFKYYLSRQHWMDAQVPPLESRLNEFVAKLLQEDDA